MVRVPVCTEIVRIELVPGEQIVEIGAIALRVACGPTDIALSHVEELNEVISGKLSTRFIK